MYATFIQFGHFHLSKYGALIKSIFTDCSVLTDSAFCFALPLLLCWMNFFDPLMSSSFMQCPEFMNSQKNFNALLEEKLLKVDDLARNVDRILSAFWERGSPDLPK